jgi:hypothetical protein
MKHIAEASEGPRKKTGTALIAEAMERTRFQSKKETPDHPEEYWKYHPEDLAAALVELLLEDAPDKADPVMDVVYRVIDIYKREDYDYVVTLAKKGQKPEGIGTIKEEIDFLKRNSLVEGLSEKQIREVARLALTKIADLNKGVYARYSK